MKSLIAKLGAIVFVGVLALTGCTKELEQQVADLQTQTESLWSEVKALKSSLESTYVTKAELQALSASLAEVKTAVEAKADKTALEAAVASLEAQLKNFATAEALTALSGKVDALKAAVEAIKSCDCDLTPVNNSIAALETSLTSYIAKTDAAIKEIQDELAKINSEAFLAEVYKYIKTQDQAIIDQITDLAAQLAEANQAIIDAAAQAEAALKAAQEAGKCAADDVRKEFKAADAALTNRISAVESRLSALESKLNNAGCSCNFQPAIDNLTNKYNGLNSRLSALENQFSALANAPRGVVLVPEYVVNGMPTVEFDILTYNAGMASAVAHACYLVNPSDAYFDTDILSVVSREATITKAGEAAVEIVDVEECENPGEYQVNFRLANLDENIFALAVESLEAYIYSDYAQIVYNETKASDLTFKGAEVTITVDKTVKIADYVAVKGCDLKAYGLEYAYQVTEGKVTVANGVVYATPEAAGKNVVAVKVMNGQDEVLTANLVVNVEVPAAPAVYEYATATVTADAERVAFEATDAKAWLVNLKNEPNTIELIKNATKAVIAKNYAEAYTILGGVPGFVYKNAEFSADGEAYIKIAEVATKADALADIDFEKYYEQIVNAENLTQALAFFADLAKNHPEEAETVLNAVKNVLNKVELPDSADLIEKIAFEAAKAAIKSMNVDTLIGILGNEKLMSTIVSVVGKYVDMDTIKDVAKKLVDTIKDKIGSVTPEPEPELDPDPTPDTPVDPETPADPEWTEVQKEAVKNAKVNLADAMAESNSNILANLEKGAWGQLAKAAQIAALVTEKVDVETLNKIVDNLSTDQLEQILGALPQEVKDLVNTIINADYSAILEKLPLDQVDQLLAKLENLEIPQEAKDLIKKVLDADLSSILDKLPVSDIKNLINNLPDELKDLIGKLPVGDLNDIITNLPGLDMDSVIDNVTDNITKEQIENIIETLPEETIEDLVNEFTGRDDITMDKINEVLDNLTDEEIRDIISSIPEDELDDLINQVLPNLDLDQILGALTKADVDYKEVLAKLDIEQLKALLNNLPVEDLLANIQIPDVDINAVLASLSEEVKAALEKISVEDFTVLLEQVPVAQIKAVISQLSDKAQGVLNQVPVEKIKDVLYQFVNSDLKEMINNITKEDIKAVISMLPEVKDAVEGLVENGYELATWKWNVTEIEVSEVTEVIK